jgi:hypothetical protein
MRLARLYEMCSLSSNFCVSVEGLPGRILVSGE